MGTLTDAYEDARDGAGSDEPALLAVLETTLTALMARGRAAHPNLAVDEYAFAAHLGRCGAPVGAESIHIEDLYLAFAALQRVPGALERLQAQLRPHVARYLRRVGGAQGLLDEVEQRLWDTLLVGGDSGPRLATYSGSGPLQKWVGVSATRIALMILRHEDAESRARGEATAQSQLVTESPELTAIKERYRAPFERALRAAVELLDDRERTLYRMHLIEGLTLERIAKVYGVHHTTVSRWIGVARERLSEEIKSRLRAELKLSSGEFESLVRVLASNLELSISRVLGKYI